MSNFELYMNNVKKLCQYFNTIHETDFVNEDVRYLGELRVISNRYDKIVYVKGHGFTISSDHYSKGKSDVYMMDKKFGLSYYRFGYEMENLTSTEIGLYIKSNKRIVCNLTEEAHFQTSLVYDIPSFEVLKELRVLMSDLYEKYPEIHSAYFSVDITKVKL